MRMAVRHELTYSFVFFSLISSLCKLLTKNTANLKIIDARYQLSTVLSTSLLPENRWNHDNGRHLFWNWLYGYRAAYSIFKNSQETQETATCTLQDLLIACTLDFPALECACNWTIMIKKMRRNEIVEGFLLTQYNVHTKPERTCEKARKHLWQSQKALVTKPESTCAKARKHLWQSQKALEVRVLCIPHVESWFCCERTMSL